MTRDRLASWLPWLLGVSAFVVPALAGDETGASVGFVFALLHLPVFWLARRLAGQAVAGGVHTVHRVARVSLAVLLVATVASAWLGSTHGLAAITLLAATLMLAGAYVLGVAGAVRAWRARRPAHRVSMAVAPPAWTLPAWFRCRQRRAVAGWLCRAAAIGPLWAAIAAFGIVIHAGSDPWPFGAPLSTAAMTASLLGVFGVTLAWMLPAFLLDLKGRRLLMPSARATLDADRRPPILFLRGFGEESAKMPFEGQLYEQSLAEVFGRIGPVVAVGRPETRLPDLGATRVYLAHEDWQRGVLFLLDHAQLVLLQVADTEGVAWEIEQVLQRTPLDRLLLFFPAVEVVEAGRFLRWVARRWPDLALDLKRRVHLTVRIQDRVRLGAFDRARPQVRQAKWARWRERFAHLLPMPLPEQLGDAVFLMFDADGRPRLLGLAADLDARDVDGAALVAAALRDFIARFEPAPCTR